MTDYIREALKPSIEAFADAIKDEEAGASEFVRSTLTSWFEIDLPIWSSSKSCRRAPSPRTKSKS
jgi:hypothetical protein